MVRDRQGRLWFGTSTGVIRYDGGQSEIFTTQNGLAHNWVDCILEDRDDHLWFGSPNGKMSRYDGKTFTAFGPDDGLPPYDIVTIYQDRDGHLWISTQGGGVSRYDGRTFQTLTQRDGLAGDHVLSMLQDRRGHLWFGTFGRGVFRYDGRTFQRLGQADGLADNVVQAIFEDRQGNIWFGSNTGLTRFRSLPPAKPPIALDAVVADRRYEGLDELAIASTVRLVAFEFHGTSFKTRPGTMLYRYQLQGHDLNWRTTSSERVEYEDLATGTYTFAVQAVDRDLGYSEMPASLRLTIHPPYGLFALVGVALLGLATALGTSKETTRRKSDFLARMSHDLRTPMNAIIGYTRILLRQARDMLNERQFRNLDNIRVSADNLLTLINDILDLSKIEAGRIDLNPEDVDLKQLATECIVSVESLVKSGVQLRREMEDVNAISTDVDRIRRVVMNLLSNALKFTEEGSITVSLKAVDRGVEFSVADTGLGIAAEDLPHIFDEFRQSEGQGEAKEEGSGLGLSIAKKSVELLGGAIEVESEVGKGTKFTLRIADYEERQGE